MEVREARTKISEGMQTTETKAQAPLAEMMTDLKTRQEDLMTINAVAATVTTSPGTTVTIIPRVIETIVTAVVATGIDDHGHVVGAVTDPAEMTMTPNKNNPGILICEKKSQIRIPQRGQIINQPSRKELNCIQDLWWTRVSHCPQS